MVRSVTLGATHICGGTLTHEPLVNPLASALRPWLLRGGNHLPCRSYGAQVSIERGALLLGSPRNSPLNYTSFVHLYEGKNGILSSTFRFLDPTVSLWGDKDTNQDPVTQQPHVPQQPLPNVFFFSLLFFYFLFFTLWNYDKTFTGDLEDNKTKLQIVLLSLGQQGDPTSHS